MDNFKEIKSKADILNVIEQITKSKTKKQGETFNLECCPFCQHKDCFKINQKEQYFNCFSCSSKGDIHNFVQNFYQLDKYEALKKLAELTNYQLSNHSDKNPSNILIDIVEYYHKNLMTNKTLLDFQIKQRTHSIKSLKLMRVGLATGRLRTYLTKKGYSDKEQLETGLIKSKDGIYKDFFIKDVFVYPHKLSNNIYGHFTIKDHSKKFQYQLSNEYRNVECLFYNQPAFNNNEIILVEGENDVLSLMDAGFKNVIGICGQISEKQLKYLEQWVSESKEQKTIYLSFDNDDPGRTYTEKVIKLLEFDCYVDRLQKELGSNVILNIIDIDKKYKDIDEYLSKNAKTNQERKSQLAKRLFKRARRHLLILKDELKRYKAVVEERNESSDVKIKPSNITIGKICAEYFNLAGSYFVDKNNGYACNLFYNDHINEISKKDVPFCALMNRVANLNSKINGFEIILQEIIDYAFDTGKAVDIPGWITSNISQGVIYFNLCNERNELLKLSPNETEIVKNGSNTERILLKNAPKMQGIDYDTTVSVKESMILMKELIFDNLACPEEEKYYIICFIINSFFVNFFKAKGLLKFSGNAGSGKTTAAELITALIFGEVLITTGTTASDYTEATQSPLIILDNLERDGLNTQKKDFLLFLATGVTRRKRDQNNQTGNVYEKVNSQGIITGIEPFEKDELIQRTIELDFKKDYWGNAFSQTEITEEIKQNRNKILSGIIKMISFDILPDFKEKRKKALLFLQQTHTGHSKERLNELFAVLFIVLKEVSKYIPYAGFNETKHQHILLLEKWIQKQDRRAKNTSKNTNEIVKFLESLLDSYLYHENEFSRDFPEIKVEESKAMYTNETESVIITISTQHLLAFFDYEAKRKGIKNPFRTAQALNARIRNSISILKESSWEYKSKVSRDGRGNYKHHLIKYFENQT